MPIGGDLCAVDNRNGQGLEVVVQRFGQAKRLPIFAQVAMGHLRQCMYTGIGAPSSGDGMGARLELGQSRLDRALHAGHVFLSLPACEGGAVVFNFQGITRHSAVPSACRGR